MAKPRKKMGRPLEDVSLRQLVKDIRKDIQEKLALVSPGEAATKPHKPKRK